VAISGVHDAEPSAPGPRIEVVALLYLRARRQQRGLNGRFINRQRIVEIKEHGRESHISFSRVKPYPMTRASFTLTCSRLTCV
jgi:hypothetical protein